jgi:hypothetical protein
MKAALWLGAALMTTAALAASEKKPAERPPAQWIPADGKASRGGGRSPSTKGPKPPRPAATQPALPAPEDITADLESLYREGTYEGAPPPPGASPEPPASGSANAASARFGAGPGEFGGGPPVTAGAAAAAGAAQAPAGQPKPTDEDSTGEGATLEQAPPELFPHGEEEPRRGVSQTSLGLQKTAQAPAGAGGFGSQFGLGVAGVLEQTAKYARVPDRSYDSLIATHMELFYAGVSEWTRWELYGQLAIYDFSHEDETRPTPMLFAVGPGGRLGLSRHGFDWLVGAGYALFMGDFRGTPPAEPDALAEPEKTRRQVGCGVASTTLRSPLPASAGRVFYTLQGHFCGQDWQQTTGYRDGVYAHVLGLEASG